MNLLQLLFSKPSCGARTIILQVVLDDTILNCSCKCRNKDGYFLVGLYCSFRLKKNRPAICGTILLLTKTKIINNQFITLQRSYVFTFFLVKNLLLLCCSYVNVFNKTPPFCCHIPLFFVQSGVLWLWPKRFFLNPDLS